MKLGCAGLVNLHARVPLHFGANRKSGQEKSSAINIQL